MKNIQSVFWLNAVVCVYIAAVMMFSSCKKSVTAEVPTTTVLSDAIFSTDETAVTVLNGIYSQMSRNYIQGTNGISYICGLSADEFFLDNIAAVPGVNSDLYKNKLGNTNNVTTTWGNYFDIVFRCNAAIEGLEKSTTLTPVIEQRLLGEAKFVRAFAFFYLTNLYGDIPVIVSTDYKVSSLASRSSKSLVYQQIIADLKEAQANLSDNFTTPNMVTVTTERVRPTKHAATALLARTYLYMEEWAKAEEEATKIISNVSLFDLVPLNNVFLKNSKEAIWQLQPVRSSFNTDDAVLYVIPPTGPSLNNNPVYLTDELLNSFEKGDQRTTYGYWVDSVIYKLTSGTLDTVYHPYKYKINLPNTSVTTAGAMQEYLMVFRVSEQYLIRAEARAKQNNVPGAVADLNLIRTRARITPTTAIPNPLPNIATSISATQLTDAILQERRVELFSEWGHRWFDLVRTGKIDMVMTAQATVKASTWEPYRKLFPIPQGEIDKNPNMKQTPGYQ